AETARTLRVALNLTVAHYKEVFEQTLRFSENRELASRLVDDPGSIDELLMRQQSQLPRGLVEVADAKGMVVGRLPRQGPPRLEALSLPDQAEPIRRALGYERRVTVAAGRGHLVVRAFAPIVSEGYQLRGAVVASIPFDAEFADRLKAELSADV